MYPFPDGLRTPASNRTKSMSVMKKIYALFLGLVFTTGAVMAQDPIHVASDATPEHQVYPNTSPTQPGTSTPAAFFPPLKEGRVRLSLHPNPMSIRAVLDAGGVTITRVTISDSIGHVWRVYNAVNAERLEIVRDDLSPGVYLVQAITAQGSAGIKMMVE